MQPAMRGGFNEGADGGGIPVMADWDDIRRERECQVIRRIGFDARLVDWKILVLRFVVFIFMSGLGVIIAIGAWE